MSMTDTVAPARPLPRLVAFDLDDTLAPSKSPVPEPMARALRALLDLAPKTARRIRPDGEDEEVEREGPHRLARGGDDGEDEEEGRDDLHVGRRAVEW